MISEKIKNKAAAIRNILDDVIREIGAVDETTFNAAASQINTKAAAIRTWTPTGDYLRGDIVIDPENETPYWAMHDHGKTTGLIHQPSLSPTIWTHCHGTTPETAREFIVEAHNPYNVGHYCIENNIVACCKQDGVVYPPSVLPNAWEIVE